MWRGGLTYRRVAVLLRRLPADSATVATVRDEPEERPQLASVTEIKSFFGGG